MDRIAQIKVFSDYFPALLGLFKVITTDRVVYLENLKHICLSLPLYFPVIILVVLLQGFEPAAEIIHLLCLES